MQRRSRLRLLLALLGALTLFAAACGDDDTASTAADETTTTEAEADDGGTDDEDTTGAEDDGDTGDEPSEGGELAGDKGTTPAPEITDAVTDFQAKMDAHAEKAGIDLDGTYAYGPEAYDTTMIIVLAAQVAGDDGSAHAAE